jgi:hypothetical protein
LNFPAAAASVFKRQERSFHYTAIVAEFNVVLICYIKYEEQRSEPAKAGDIASFL